MAEKLIIQIEDDTPIEKALDVVKAVVAAGRVSMGRHGPQFCFHTSFTNGLHCSVVQNEQSERFIIYREEK